MIIQDDEKSHYLWIKNLNKLLNSKNNKQMFRCERCLIRFTRDDLLQSHLVECRGINEQAVKIQMPTVSNRIIKFVNHKNQLKCPWVIYANFESIIKKIDAPVLSTDKSFTQKTRIQEACEFCIRAVRSDGLSPEPIVYRGQDCIQVFLEQLKEAELVIKQSLKKKRKEKKQEA